MHGCVYELRVTNAKDMDRQLIKSDSASVRIPEIDFEIPPGTQKGEISTIEGILRTAARNLGMYQEERMEQMPEVGTKVAEIILALNRMASGSSSVLPFRLVLDDPAGNSFVENPNAPLRDPCLTLRNYIRTAAQDEALGLQGGGGDYRADDSSNFKSLVGGGFGASEGAVVEGADGEVRLGHNEVVSIPSPCPNCGGGGESLTAVTSIPHFKEVTN